MIQTSFVVVFLSSDIYERPVLIQLTVFPMTVHAGFILHRFIQNWLLHVLAKDCVSVGCLLLFFCLSKRFIGFAYDSHVVICWESTVGIKSAKSTKFSQDMTNIYAGECYEMDYCSVSARLKCQF